MTFFDDIMEEITDFDGVITPILQMKKRDSTGVTEADIIAKAGSKSDMAKIIFKMTKQLISGGALLKKCGSHIEVLNGKLVSATEQLVEKHSDLEKSVKEQLNNTAQEMKAYSEVLQHNIQKPCEPEARSREQNLTVPIIKAMKYVKEQEDRSKNIIINGIDLDPNSDNTFDDIQNQLFHLMPKVMGDISCAELNGINDDEETPTSYDIEIMGKIDKPSGKAPPIRVKFSSKDHVHEILKNSPILSSKQNKACNRVYIDRDFTKEELIERKRLIGKLKEKIANNPSIHWKIKGSSIINCGERKNNIKKKSATQTSFSYDIGSLFSNLLDE